MLFRSICALPYRARVVDGEVGVARKVHDLRIDRENGGKIGNAPVVSAAVNGVFDVLVLEDENGFGAGRVALRGGVQFGFQPVLFGLGESAAAVAVAVDSLQLKIDFKSGLQCQAAEPLAHIGRYILEQRGCLTRLNRCIILRRYHHSKVVER